MAYGLSNGHVTDDVTTHVTLKGHTSDPNMLTAQYLQNYLQIIFPQSGRGLGHVTSTEFGTRSNISAAKTTRC